ncbi:MAG TPA: ParB/RepB/Spo0J family partition protein [Candidatus Cloacimonadota bacterium]|nr:ParB/RepB/Spo0J family partition protein [Candidatus Cloacimonadota bacterium]
MNERLGRGLGALIPDSDPAQSPAPGLGTLATDQIMPNRYQPRKKFDLEKLAELAESIKENGIIQPIIVTKTEGSDYELIAGERRLEAAKLAGLERVPVVIRSVSKKEQLQLAIIENVQREDLDPIEEALAYRVLSEDFALTHKDIAQIMSKERTTISNSLRLLNLPPEVQDLVSSGTLSAGHARAVLALEDQYQTDFAAFICKYNLTVRQAEEKSKTWAEKLSTQKEDHQSKTALNRSLELELKDILGVRAILRENKGKGKLTLQFGSLEELEALKTKLLSLK